jgi:hypothetical protein
VDIILEKKIEKKEAEKNRQLQQVYIDIGKNYCHDIRRGSFTESIQCDTILEQLGRCLVFWTRPDDHWTPPQAMFYS